MKHINKITFNLNWREVVTEWLHAVNVDLMVLEQLQDDVLLNIIRQELHRLRNDYLSDGIKLQIAQFLLEHHGTVPMVRLDQTINLNLYTRSLIILNEVVFAGYNEYLNKASAKTILILHLFPAILLEIQFQLEDQNRAQTIMLLREIKEFMMLVKTSDTLKARFSNTLNEDHQPGSKVLSIKSPDVMAGFSPPAIDDDEVQAAVDDEPVEKKVEMKGAVQKRAWKGADGPAVQAKVRNMELKGDDPAAGRKIRMPRSIKPPAVPAKIHFTRGTYQSQKEKQRQVTEMVNPVVLLKKLNLFNYLNLEKNNRQS